MITVQQAQDLAGAIAITGAPKIDPDGQLTGREEVQLFKHYRLFCGEQGSGLALWRAGQSRRAEDRRAAGRASWKAVTACEGLLAQGGSSLAALFTATALERQSAG